MVASEQKRQKKLAKQRSKILEKKRSLARQKQAVASLAGQMKNASRFPIEFCKVTTDLLKRPGIGNVILCRRVQFGQFAIGVFLIDASCLGIKNAFGKVFDRTELDDFVQEHSYKDIQPEDGLAIIEQATAYAGKLGFAPHPDAAKVLPFFGRVDSSLSEFELPLGGVDGKPHYINGPFDDAARRQAIVNQLNQSVGEGNFHVTFISM